MIRPHQNYVIVPLDIHVFQCATALAVHRTGRPETHFERECGLIELAMIMAEMGDREQSEQLATQVGSTNRFLCRRLRLSC